MKFWRIYRIAGEPYEPCPVTARALYADGGSTMLATHAKHSENLFRQAVEAGNVPESVLLAPERAVPAEIGADGQVRYVHAWREGCDPDFVRRFLGGGGAYVRAEIEADEAQCVPDPLSDMFADNGSVLIHEGRITGLTCSPWLAPAVDSLQAKYQVPVALFPGPVCPRPQVEPGPVVVSPAALDATAIAYLRDWYETYNADECTTPGAPPEVRGCEPPATIGQTMLDAACSLGDAFGLPVNGVKTGMLGYSVGGFQARHRDLEELEPFSVERTVSYSILLSEPGGDFEGGDFIGPDGPVTAHAGDLIGFTARTFHEIAPVTAGFRLVLLAFGRFER